MKNLRLKPKSDIFAKTNNIFKPIEIILSEHLRNHMLWELKYELTGANWPFSF